jgi:hypothetical protein
MGNTPVHKHIDGKLFFTFHVTPYNAVALYLSARHTVFSITDV